eukprot:Sspe_Gene.54245::Locus_29947_Transcript_1_1_Confidence_1.000_Length_649::g.54245::m.54245
MQRRGTTDSAKFSRGGSPIPFDVNPMTQWLHSYNFWVLYILTIAMLRLFLWVLVADPAVGWTITSVVHSILSYVFLHWLKGAPIGDLSIRGRYDHMTFWEQIDGSFHGTPTRKLFTTVPIIIFFIALNWVRDNYLLLAWLIASLAMSIIPKLPMFNTANADVSPPVSPVHKY